MITGIALVCVWVPDHDAGYDFYVGTLGMKVATDAPMEGGGRWLVVYVPAQPEVPIMLCAPGPPIMDEKKAAEIRELIASGDLGVGAFATGDCRATYEELKAKGVEFTEEPTERFYGIDAAFRDPFGNPWRLTQPKPIADGPVRP